MATGVFSLRKVYIRQYQNVDNRNFASWPESAIYGYYGGGITPPVLGTISRINFSNDTVTNATATIPGSYYLAATSSAFYGYFAGGYNGVGNLSTIARLDFSSEVVSLPGQNLPVARRSLKSISSSSYGYFAGGFTSVLLSSILRIDFSSETISDPGKNLPAVISDSSTISNSSYGYFGGGYGPGPSNYSSITKFDFLSETTSNIGQNLPTARRLLEATSSPSYGYFGGGYTPPAYISTITRFDFLSETASNPGQNLPTARGHTATTSSSSYGYYAGGATPVVLNTISRLDFSNEIVSNPGQNLPTARYSLAGLSGGQSIYRGFKTYGYITGGSTWAGGLSTNVNKHDLSTTTVSGLPPSNVMPSLGPSPSGVGRNQHFGFSTNYFGYFSGGFQSGGLPGNTNRVSRLDFSNDTWNDPGKDLPVTRYSHTGVSAPHNYDRGYFATGVTFIFPNPIGPTNISTVTRIQYSTETVSNPGINMPFVAENLAAVKTGSYGYFTGGRTPVSNPAPTNGLVYSNVARLDFSNENISLPVNLPLQRWNMFSFYNKSYGYFCGGNGPNPLPPTPTNHCRIERLDFSNETISSRTNMPTAYPSATSISSQFFGFSYGTVNLTQIYRFDFSSETFAPYTSTPLGLSSAAAVSNGI
jgi:hypothetical protein